MRISELLIEEEGSLISLGQVVAKFTIDLVFYHWLLGDRSQILVPSFKCPFDLNVARASRKKRCYIM